MVADLNLTDMETCYKAFRMSLVRSIPIRSNRFGIEPEITIKFAKRQASIYEVPISYHGRTYEQGKKIGAKDAVAAICVILRGWLTRDIYCDDGAHILDSLSGTTRFNRWMAETVVLPHIGSRVLELGAGIGNLTQHLSRGRKAYTATDIDEEHLGRLRVRFRGRPNVAIRKVDITAPEDFLDLRGKADTVVCLNVVEHVKDDLLALRNMRSALEAGGRAIILVPQDQSVYGTLDEVLGHFRRYSKADLKALMEAAGFEVDRIFEFNRVTRPGWWWNGRVLRRRTFGRLQLKIFDVLVPLWRRIDGVIPWNGVSVIAVGRVPK
jgi:2-polyprenyl-3-methyl-5-hydroxy-6-metoxy-1,4-benzoquinol methylase